MLHQNFLIYPLILYVPMPLILTSFFTHGSHSYFVWIWYTTRWSFGWKVVHLNTSSHSPPYYNNPPLFCFSLNHQWCPYYWFYLKCGTHIFTIASGVYSIKIFHSTNEMSQMPTLWNSFIWMFIHDLSLIST